MICLQLRRFLHRLWYFLYRVSDLVFRYFDNRHLQVVEHLRLIPPARHRTGGQTAISEYGYSAGVIAGYIGEHLTVGNPQVLDLGCGTGKLVMAAWPFLGDSGHYTGLDIDSRAIAFDQKWYPSGRCSFIHAPIFNAHYNPAGLQLSTYTIPLAKQSIDLALAFSLFTHLNQVDSTHYFKEMGRVMKPGGVALFTFFLLDERYEPARFENTRWHFDRTIPDQPEWYWASWFKIPERQIAVTPRGIKLLMGDDLELIKVYRGWWTGQPGAHLQDTLVFRRK